MAFFLTLLNLNQQWFSNFRRTEVFKTANHIKHIKTKKLNFKTLMPTKLIFSPINKNVEKTQLDQKELET